MNRVLSGEYEGCKIGLDSSRRCLYIKSDSGNVLLVKGSVARYDLRETLALSGDKVYAIKWGDGAVSVIRVEKAYQQILIIGCETGARDVDEKKSGGGIGVFLLGCAVLAIVFIALGSSFSQESREKINDSPNPQKNSQRTWAEWDGISEKPTADMLVQTTDTVGLTPTTGLASGYFVNNSDYTYSHLEVIYEITSDGVTKIGECPFSMNDANLAPGETQGFTAICNAWGDTPHIGVSSVGFY